MRPSLAGVLELRLAQSCGSRHVFEQQMFIKDPHELRGCLIGNTPVAGNDRRCARLQESLRRSQHAFAWKKPPARGIAGTQHDEARIDLHLQDLEQTERTVRLAVRCEHECGKPRAEGVDISMRRYMQQSWTACRRFT